MTSHQQMLPTSHGTSTFTSNHAQLSDSRLSSGTSFSATSNRTFALPTSAMKTSIRRGQVSAPRILRTGGARPAQLVNASVTYCGNNELYVFGGFDQFTDEVYNHVLKLDLDTLNWTLVDNYGDIPGVRMGHTATLWQGQKLLIYGGENEHRDYLSDVIIFDLKTAHWTQPEICGEIPRGRGRHAALVHDDKLFIIGGLTGISQENLSEICYLDLKTWTWSRSWNFVSRYDHSAWIWGERLWVFGGISPNMERTNELWWLDLNSHPAFRAAPAANVMSATHHPSNSSSRSLQATMAQPQSIPPLVNAHAANTSSIQVRAGPSSHPLAMAMGSVYSIKFISGPSVPSQAFGKHFHVCSSGKMLDFVTPSETTRSWECNLSTFALDTLQWQKLAEGSDLFNPNYRWYYCAVNDEGTKAWFLGYGVDRAGVAAGPNADEECLSEILPLDLEDFGLMGNDLASELRANDLEFAISRKSQNLKPTSLGADLANMFDQQPEKGSGSDFIVTAEADEVSKHPSPIHVHKLILQARWPHFNRVCSAEMTEFHTNKMHIPEPHSVVRAFLYYLYTDSISQHNEYCHGLAEVAGLLVLANAYDMAKLRFACLHRLSLELDVESAAVVWERAGTAGELWLKRQTATFCLAHWGRLVRTDGFRSLCQQSMVELCEMADVEGRVVSGDELEAFGGFIDGKYGLGALNRSTPKDRRTQTNVPLTDDMEDVDGDDAEGMDVN